MNIINYIFFLILLLILPVVVKAQPANNTCANAMPLVVDAPCQQATNNGATADGNANCGALAFMAGKTVWFSFTATGPNTQISVTNVSGNLDVYLSVFTSCGSGSVKCVNSTGNNQNESMVLNTISGTTYLVMVDGYGGIFGVGANADGNFCIQVSTYIPPPNPSGNCAGAQPFCTGSTYTFPAATNTQSEIGPNYDCLTTQPNPAWYYLKIQNPGQIDIHMASDANQDIDFICWGPFTSPQQACSLLMLGQGANVDCSYFSDPEEDCVIPNAQTGEYYMLLITNFSNQPNNIIFSQTGGSGSTDCSIINPVIVQNNGPLCPGQTLSLSATLINGASYSWTGPNGFTSAIRNPSISNTTVANSGLYTLVTTIGASTYSSTTTATVFAANSPECSSQIVCNVNASVDDDTVCLGTSVNLSALGGIYRAVLSNTFNNGTVGVGWVGTPTANFSNPGCAGAPPYASTFLWMDNTTPAPRRLESNDFDVSNGGVISFWMKFAVQSGTVPCEGPDLPGEGVTLQYSVTGGTSWVDISYFSPGGTQMATNPDPGYSNMTPLVNGGQATAFTSWARYAYPIPVGASTASTRFRWMQHHSTDANTDNWGIDSVLIKTPPPGLTYTWSTSPTGASIGTGTALVVTPTANTTYYVTVSDGLYSCSDSVKVVVYAVDPSFTVNDSTQCRTGNSFTFTSTGTAYPGSIHYWNFGNGNSSNLTNPSVSFLNDGIYAVTHTVKNGTCIDSVSKIVYIYKQPTLTFDSVPSCEDLCTGSVTAIPNGNAPFTYSWINGGTTPTISSMCSGGYGVVVTDKNGCTVTGLGRISQHPSPTVSFFTAPSCNNACTGSLVAIGGGTVMPYVYKWDNGSGTAEIDGLCPGQYFITVTDGRGCSTGGNESVTLFPQIFIDVQTTPALCFNESTGTATATATGGQTGTVFSYKWSVNSGNQITQTAVNLAAGIYRVTATDSYGCQADTPAVVTQPDDLVITTSPDTHLCYHSSGHIYVLPEGGTEPYTYHWKNLSTGDSVFTQTVDIHPEAGCTYTIYVTDINNCSSKKKSVFISMDPEIKLNLYLEQDSICPGTNASIIGWASGGDGGPYNIYNTNWERVNFPYSYYPSKDRENVILIAKDECGASVRDTVMICYYASPLIDFNADKLHGCQPLKVYFKEETNNTGSYYTWNFNDADNNLSHSRNPVHTFETPGIYDVTLTITNKNGCQSSQTYPQMITVYQKPDARFITIPELASITQPEVTFQNYSQNYSVSVWHFGDGDSSLFDNPVHVYKEVKKYTVSLIAISEYGCMDTVEQIYHIRDEYTFFAPTAFSPDQNGRNEVFNVYGKGINPSKFVMYIYNRWGELIYETTELNKGWDGKTVKTSSPKDVVKSGVYTWFVIYTDMAGVVHTETGPVTLIH